MPRSRRLALVSRPAARRAEPLRRDPRPKRRGRKDCCAGSARRAGSCGSPAPFRKARCHCRIDASDREEMARILRGRPVWLAAMVQTGELATVLDAHEKLSRVAHRSLLMLVPDDLADSATFAQHLTETGWRSRHVVRRRVAGRGDAGGAGRHAGRDGALVPAGDGHVHGLVASVRAITGAIRTSPPRMDRRSSTGRTSRATKTATPVTPRRARRGSCGTRRRCRTRCKRSCRPIRSALMAQAAWDVASKGRERHRPHRRHAARPARPAGGRAMSRPRSGSRPPGPRIRGAPPVALGWLYGQVTARRMARAGGWRAPLPVICVAPRRRRAPAGRRPCRRSRFTCRRAGCPGDPVAAWRAAARLTVDPQHHTAADVGDVALLHAAFAPTWVAQDPARAPRHRRRTARATARLHPDGRRLSDPSFSRT